MWFFGYPLLLLLLILVATIIKTTSTATAPIINTCFVLSCPALQIKGGKVVESQKSRWAHDAHESPWLKHQGVCLCGNAGFLKGCVSLVPGVIPRLMVSKDLCTGCQRQRWKRFGHFFPVDNSFEEKWQQPIGPIDEVLMPCRSLQNWLVDSKHLRSLV